MKKSEEQKPEGSGPQTQEHPPHDCSAPKPMELPEGESWGLGRGGRREKPPFFVPKGGL